MLLGQASGMAFLGTLPCAKSCYISINGNAKSSWSERKNLFISCLRLCREGSLGENGAVVIFISELYVIEDELKLMLCGAELSGAIVEEEQDMIENVLEIKDTLVGEVMTPIVESGSDHQELKEKHLIYKLEVWS
ncbi:hypothetical protein Pint_03948 [Pistacia integerrima]|uniref:Uncharacterized protein n=1 Tax=Pistacia integerrima TaxID=434235 RepID=A0ACC0Z5M9_9ROSI|nr:hypothetical protein Pint_03948 [Pistacia integerrima]